MDPSIRTPHGIEVSPAEQLFWQRVQRRAATQTPDVAAAILRAFKTIRDSLSESELARLVSTRQIDRLFDTTLAQARLDAAFQPVRETMREKVYEGIRYFQRGLPKPPPSVIVGMFDTLSPHVITAIRELDTKVMERLTGDVRETFRAYIENGLRDGASPTQIARGLRSVVGLAPNQQQAVSNFRAMLENKDKEALTRALRDRRFDKTLKAALKGDGLSPQKIDAMVTAYERRMIAFNANTQARTAVMDSLKSAQRISTQDAINRGILNPDKLNRQWIGVADDRERPSHFVMNDQVVRWDQPYSNGDNYAGESEPWNCRCIDRFVNA